MSADTLAGAVPIGVCVDDFGLDAAIDLAALRLAAQERVSAISCMTRAPGWRAAASALASVSAQADLGLHLDFTQAGGGALHRGLALFIAAAYLRRLDARVLRDEIQAQLDAFEDGVGAAPDHVDGHQHVHQLPGVREALLAELVRRYPRQQPWLRDTQPSSGLALAGPAAADHRKQRLIATLGARRLRGLARSVGLPMNVHLLGVYGFSGTAEAYAQRLAAWCAQARHGDLLMCHPAVAAPATDPIGAARHQEYGVLGGERFGALLLQHGLRVERLSHVLDGSRMPARPATT